MTTAVVTLVHGRHGHLRGQQQSLLAGSVLPSPYVVVAMDDLGIDDALLPGLEPQVVHLPADPRGLPLAAARNAGVGRALAWGAETVVLIDVDCLAGRDLVAGYRSAVAAFPDVVWSGPVTYLPPPGATGYDLAGLDTLDSPHPARPAPAGHLEGGASPDLFWSLSFACHRDTWARVGGFSEDYVGYGGEDTDFGLRVVAAGAGLGWAGTPRAYHQHHPVADPPVQHLDAILRNGRVFAQRWGRWPMEGWLRAFERQGLVEQDEHGAWSRTTTRRHADVGSG